jgi:superfamily II DNA/RNA helicase
VAREEIQAHVRDRSLKLLVATDAASEGLNLQRLELLINVDLPWNPAPLEQRKGRIDRIGQLAPAIDIMNLHYRGSVEDEVHQALSSRLAQIREIFGTIPDTLEDVWVATAIG